MGPACAAPEEGAESGEQPEEPLKKPEMVEESSRPKVEPKKPDGAMKLPCTSFYTCLQPQLHHQQ